MEVGRRGRNVWVGTLLLAAMSSTGCASSTSEWWGSAAGGGVQVGVARVDGSPALDLARTSARLGLELLGALD